MGWEVFSKNIQFEVRVGNRVKFWIDQWCGDLPLHLAFSVLYNSVANRVAFVDSSLICQGAGDEKIRDVHFIMIGRRMRWMISFNSWHPIYL